MKTLFIDNPPANNLLPWSHVANGIPLTQGVSQTPTQTAIPAASHIAPHRGRDRNVASSDSSAVKSLRAGWMKKKTQVFAGKYHIPDSEDSETVNHLNWYEATGFTRPYPGETKVFAASHFKRRAPGKDDDDDGF
jgi:hypothetical protein